MVLAELFRPVFFRILDEDQKKVLYPNLTFTFSGTTILNTFRFLPVVDIHNIVRPHQNFWAWVLHTPLLYF